MTTQDMDIPEWWMKTTLGEVVKISSGKSRPKNSGIFPVYGGNGILDYADSFNFEDDTIIIGRVGAYCGCVYFENNKFWLSDNALGIKSNEKSHIKFLYYFLINQNLNKKAIGGAQPLLTQGILNQIEISIPLLSEQKEIASILSSLDDKIELLRKQNETLEKTAQTIFHEWFGKYSVDDELPEGWRVAKVRDFVEHIKISIIPQNNSNTYFLHYSIPAFDDWKKAIKEKWETIMSNKYQVVENCFLVSKLNPRIPRIWTIFSAWENAICSTEFQVIKPIRQEYFSYIYGLLNSKYFTDKFASWAHGTSSSHQRAMPEDILNIEIILCNDEVIFDFNTKVSPLIKKISSNNFQIQFLSKTRDELLPKLMNGEIRV